MSRSKYPAVACVDVADSMLIDIRDYMVVSYVYHDLYHERVQYVRSQSEILEPREMSSSPTRNWILFASLAACSGGFLDFHMLNSDVLSCSEDDMTLLVLISWVFHNIPLRYVLVISRQYQVFGVLCIGTVASLQSGSLVLASQ